MPNQKNLIAIAMTVSSCFLMATSAILFKWISLPAEVVVFFRMLLGALFFFIFLISIVKFKLSSVNFNIKSFLAGICLAAVFVLYMRSLNYLSMAVAIMFVYLGPLIATVVAHFFLKEHLSLPRALLIAVASIGFLLIQDLDSIDTSTSIAGYVYGLSSAIFYALFVVINRHPIAPGNKESHILIQMFSGALFCLPMIYGYSFDITSQQWLLIIITGLLPGCAGIILAISALQRIDTSTFNVLAYIEPISVALLGWLLFNEQLNSNQIVGVSIIITCSILLSLTSLPSTKHRLEQKPLKT